MKLFSSILAFFCAASVPALALTPQQLAVVELRAMSGDAKALYVLGQIYEIGDGVPADKSVATCYYRAAARLGDAAAKMKLGIAPASAVSDAETSLAVDCGNGVKMELLQVPAGTFTMGSPANEEGGAQR